MMKARSIKGLGVVLLVLMLGAAVAQADSIVSLVGGAPTPISGGWEYTYLIANPITGDPIFDLFLGNVDDATIVGTPTGWDTFETPPGGGNDGSVDWNTDPFGTDVVAPGQNLSGFTIRSPWGPGTDSAPVFLNGDEFAHGAVDGPAVTPEPATVVLLLVSGVGGAVVRRRRK
jgi:hypothetical protein